MATIQFVARRSFKWEGNDARYEVGDFLEINEGHPRLEAMLRGRYLGYANTQDVPKGISTDAISQADASPHRAKHGGRRARAAATA